MIYHSRNAAGETKWSDFRRAGNPLGGIQIQNALQLQRKMQLTEREREKWKWMDLQSPCYRGRGEPRSFPDRKEGEIAFL